MLKHWIWLTRCRGVGTVGCAKLLRIFGTAERIYELTETQCMQTEGFDRRWLEGILDKDTSDAERILQECDNQGIQLMVYSDNAYPERLRNIADPPAVLYYKGTFPDFDQEAVIGIVGTRRCSAYGMLQSKQFSNLIANSGGIVVSGGARGIDTMALGGALDSLMPVVCVLGCGVDVVYPRENARLFQAVCQHGCLISEYPPGTPAVGTHFPVRNRIISGLSVGILVVEAPEKSGALITANLALEQGRDVYTIPANIGAKHGAGSNRLLQEGATAVLDGWEVMENYLHLFPDKLADGRSRKSGQMLYQTRFGASLPVYSPIRQLDGEERKAVEKPPQKVQTDSKNLSAEEETVLDAMDLEPLHLDVIIERSAMAPARVLATLTMLQIKGKVAKLGGNYFNRL
jgi:DNA processing protein